MGLIWLVGILIIVVASVIIGRADLAAAVIVGAMMGYNVYDSSVEDCDDI